MPKVLDSAHRLFYAHRPCMNYIIAMFLIGSCLSTHDHLLYFARFCAEPTPKIVNKNIQQRTSPSLVSTYLPLSLLLQLGFNTKIIIQGDREEKNEKSYKQI